MPPKRKTPETPNVDALIMAEGPGGELHVRNFENLTETQEIVERDVHQLKALSLFSAINRTEFLIGHPSTLRKQGGNAARSLQGLKDQRTELAAQAKGEFYDSQRYAERKAELLASGKPSKALESTIAELDREVTRGWSSFQAQYRSPRHKDARNIKVRELRSEVRLVQSQQNREKKKRPHLTDAARKAMNHTKLTSRERLVALRDDTRAGFMPTTDVEKILAFTDLDYLDNPDCPLGIVNQRLEIYNHQTKAIVTSEKYTKRELPDRTSRTKVYELHDFWTNAQQSLGALQQLEQVIGECYNPNVSLAEEAAGHAGLNVLVRFRDIRRWRETDKTPEGMPNPLTTKEDRRPHADQQKNKTLEDIYTRREADPEMLNYIAEQAETISIRETRGLVRDAIADQENRELFLRKRLEDIKERAPDGSKFLTISKLAGRLLLEDRIRPLEYSE